MVLLSCLNLYVGFRGCEFFLNDSIFPKYRRSYNDTTFAGSCAGRHLSMLTPDVSLHRKTLTSHTSESDLEIQKEVGWMFACQIWYSVTCILIYYSCTDYLEITFNSDNHTAVQL